MSALTSAAYRRKSATNRVNARRCRVLPRVRPQPVYVISPQAFAAGGLTRGKTLHRQALAQSFIVHYFKIKLFNCLTVFLFYFLESSGTGSLQFIDPKE